MSRPIICWHGSTTLWACRMVLRWVERVGHLDPGVGFDLLNVYRHALLSANSRDNSRQY